MKKIIEALKGKKTYIVAAIVLAIWFAESVLGIDVPGAEVSNPLEWIMAALGLATTRAAIAKATDAN